VDLGLPVTLADVDLALRRSFDAVFSEQAIPSAQIPL
jgi:lipoyl(octanoyl) transferase